MSLKLPNVGIAHNAIDGIRTHGHIGEIPSEIDKTGPVYSTPPFPVWLARPTVRRPPVRLIVEGNLCDVAEWPRVLSRALDRGSQTFIILSEFLQQLMRHDS